MSIADLLLEPDDACGRLSKPCSARINGVSVARFPITNSIWTALEWCDGTFAAQEPPAASSVHAKVAAARLDRERKLP
jgi:hypothetical protein